MKWNARVMVNTTFDFEIEAETEEDVRFRVREYLAFAQGGDPEAQPLSIATKSEDKCTGIFISIDEICDVYDL